METRYCQWCKVNPLVQRKYEKPRRFNNRKLCSVKCKNEWFAESRRKENPIWTDEYKKAYEKKYRQLPGIKEKRALQNKQWRLAHVEHTIATNKLERANLRIAVLKHYSGGKMCCVQCGFSDVRALALDHIYNNGAEERKRITGLKGSGGSNFFRRLRRSGYPDGYQVLCCNCNFIKYIEWLKKK